MVAVIVGLCKGQRLEPLGRDGDGRNGDLDAARLHSREQAVKRYVLDLYALASPLGHLVDEIHLKPNKFAAGVLELPRHVANVGPNHPIGGKNGRSCNSGGNGERHLGG